MLANVKVKAELERLSKRKAEELRLSGDGILRRIAQVAFSGKEETRDRLRALDMLCKARGLYDRRPEDGKGLLVLNLNLGE